MNWAAPHLATRRMLDRVVQNGRFFIGWSMPHRARTSSSRLGAQPTQDSHLTLLLTATLPAVSLPPDCLIRVNAPLPVPDATI